MTNPNPKPTADVIELVRELRNCKCECCYHDLCGYTLELQDVFPIIAEALIIAVDALEEMAQDADMDTQDASFGDMKYKRGIKVQAQFAKSALSKIHSLTPHE